MAPYKYLPLPKDGQGVRLLHLDPGDFQDMIQFAITHERFSREESIFPTFEALSYVWGSQDDPVFVNVCPYSGESAAVKVLAFASKLKAKVRKSTGALSPTQPQPVTLEVGQNLASALRHLRLRKRVRKMWVDAICINQQDIKERSKEVAKMGDIYHQASRVVVWLGPASDNSSLALSTLAALGKQIHVDYQRRECGWAGKGDEPKWFRNLAPLPYDQTTWRAIGSMLARSWFSRVWILQEISLANPASSQIICGFTAILWRTMRAAIWFLYFLGTSKNSLLKQNLTLKTLIMASHIARMTTTDKLLRLLSITRGRVCQDDKDRVYGVLGIIVDGPEWDIRPDYSKTVEELYTEITAQIAGNLNSLSFLPDIDSEPLARAPTWVPNWSKAPRSLFLLHGHASAENCTIQFLDHEVLKVQGVYCGMTYKYSNVASEIVDGFAVAKEWEPQNAWRTSYRAGGNLLDAFLTVIVDGMLDPHVSTRLAHMPKFTNISEIKNAYLSGIEATENEALNGRIQEYFNVVSRYASGRKLLYTKEGHIGIGSCTAQPGDSVYAVIGCSLLVILRPTMVGRFEVVGTCNLHGFRHFEAMLGPLPKGWYVQDAYPYRDVYQMRFINNETGEKTVDDPRLPVRLPSGWRSEIDSDGDKSFVRAASGKRVWEDPRLSDAAFLRSRGVDVQDILLV